MTWKDAAILVLNDIGKPLHPDDILKEIFLRKLKTTRGYTPVLTLRTEMYRACSGHEHISNHSGELIFYEEGDGRFGLYNWIKNISSNDNFVSKKYVTDVINIPTVKEQSLEIHFQDVDDEVVFIEGKEKYLLHKTKERNTGLIILVKSKLYLTNPELPCFVCGFSFSKRYGKHGDKFIEAHHLTPISELTEATETKLEDIVLVCSNCHKMIHRFRPWLSIDELKNILNKQTAS